MLQGCQSLLSHHHPICSNFGDHAQSFMDFNVAMMTLLYAREFYILSLYFVNLSLPKLNFFLNFFTFLLKEQINSSQGIRKGLKWKGLLPKFQKMVGISMSARHGWERGCSGLCNSFFLSVASSSLSLCKAAPEIHTSHGFLHCVASPNFNPVLICFPPLKCVIIKTVRNPVFWFLICFLGSGVKICLDIKIGFQSWTSAIPD